MSGQRPPNLLKQKSSSLCYNEANEGIHYRQNNSRVKYSFDLDVLEHFLRMFGEFRMSRGRNIRRLLFRGAESQHLYCLYLRIFHEPQAKPLLGKLHTNQEDRKT